MTAKSASTTTKTRKLFVLWLTTDCNRSLPEEVTDSTGFLPHDAMFGQAIAQTFIAETMCFNQLLPVRFSRFANWATAPKLTAEDLRACSGSICSFDVIAMIVVVDSGSEIPRDS